MTQDAHGPAVTDESRTKLDRLLNTLRSMNSVLVAYSGGVDSTLLLSAAHEALGDRAVAVFCSSPVYPQKELEDAGETARAIGAEMTTIDTHEMSDPAFRANPEDRCYHCKGTMFATLIDLAKERRLDVVVEGSNVDDLQDYRPGKKAIEEFGIRSPLMEVGLTKAEIRALSRSRGLRVWDKPSLACLASRIPYDSEISEGRLRRIERSEEAILGLGFRQVRVRDHGEVARIEIEPSEISTLAEPATREAVVAALRQAGYTYVSVDLSGYRTGAMNEVRGR